MDFDAPFSPPHSLAVFGVVHFLSYTHTLDDTYKYDRSIETKNPRHISIYPSYKLELMA